MKKICMVVPSFTAKGGIATVVNGYRDSDLEKKYDINYIETYCDGNKISKLIKALRAYIVFSKEIFINKPDIVHVHSSFGASFFRKLPFIYISYLFSIPIINHIHGSAIDDLYINASNLKRKIVEKTYEKCDYTIVLSEEWKEKIKIIKFDRPIFVIENYSVLHPDAFSENKTGKKTVLFLGFITKLKGCFDIPFIVEKVVEKYKNVEFILGGVGNINELQNVLNKKGLNWYVVFPGWIQNDKKDFLFRRATLFLLPSYEEAMPMSILEAMGYGLPIVSCNIGGIPQLVKDNKNGYLFNPGDVDGISNAIIDILENKNKCEMFGKESFYRANALYSIEQHFEKLSHLYENVYLGK